MKGHKMKASGGAAMTGSKGTKEEDKEVEDKKSDFKRGGKAKHKKHGGKVDGKKPKARADKMKRGGHVKHHKGGGMVKSAAGMSAGSPMSGAGTKVAKTPALDREDD